MAEKRYIIMGRDSCAFCVFAQDFCHAKSLETVYLDYTNNIPALKDSMKFYKMKTVPIILENDLDTGKTHLVGGYTDLLEILK